MDRELLVQSARRDREAFELIVAGQGRAAVSHGPGDPGQRGRRARRHAGDVHRVVAQFCRLRDLDRFDAWLGRILINECRMALRKRRRVREVPIRRLTSDAPAAAPRPIRPTSTTPSPD